MTTNKAPATTQTTAIEKPKKTIFDLISDMRGQFEKGLPKHVSVDRFLRVALTTVRKTPKLADCSQESLFSCLMDCTALGLEPDNRSAYLIPYGTVCTLIVSYKGLISLARRSALVSDIHCDIVCQNDTFDYSFGTGAKLIHKPALEDRGNIIAAYSYVRLTDGSESFEVMSLKEIDAIMARSKASRSGPWVTDKPEMAKKTVFRRHSKWLPWSSDMQDAIEKDFDTPELQGMGVDAPRSAVPMPIARSQMPVDGGQAAGGPNTQAGLSEADKAQILEEERLEREGTHQQGD